MLIPPQTFMSIVDGRSKDLRFLTVSRQRLKMQTVYHQNCNSNVIDHSR